ncbi:unnamed protein product, partial [Urochloa humidicola]
RDSECPVLHMRDQTQTLLIVEGPQKDFFHTSTPLNFSSSGPVVANRTPHRPAPAPPPLAPVPLPAS